MTIYTECMNRLHFYKEWTEIEHALKNSVFVPYMDKFKNENGEKSVDLLTISVYLLND